MDVECVDDDWLISFGMMKKISGRLNLLARNLFVDGCVRVVIKTMSVYCECGEEKHGFVERLRIRLVMN